MSTELLVQVPSSVVASFYYKDMLLIRNPPGALFSQLYVDEEPEKQ